MMIIIFRVPNKFLKLFFLFSLFSSELIWEMPSQTSVLSFFKWKILCLLHRSLGYQEGRNRRSDSNSPIYRDAKSDELFFFFSPICANSWPRRHFYADFRRFAWILGIFMTRFKLMLPVPNQKPPKGLAPFTYTVKLWKSWGHWPS